MAAMILISDMNESHLIVRKLYVVMVQYIELKEFLTKVTEWVKYLLVLMYVRIAILD